MKIAVFSPMSRSGLTAATLLMGYTIAFSQGRTVRLCYTGDNQAIKRYSGTDTMEQDATRTISQVSKLLEAHAIKPADLGDYCVNLGPNIDIMYSWDPSLTEDEVTSLLQFTFAKTETDFTFCDLAYDLDDPSSKAILEECDALVAVTEPSYDSLRMIKDIKESHSWPKDKPCALLISKYHEEIGSVKNLAKIAGFKLRNTCKLHFNPYIVESCNSGTLDTMTQFVLRKDPRVVELNSDLKECTQFFLSLSKSKIKWEG